LKAAKKALTEAGCKLGKVHKRHQKHGRKGKVVSSDPRAGTTHRTGTKIALTISG
jgi:beta-lactam-binding protein with PASTA domain